jgi:hypothetical protein
LLVTASSPTLPVLVLTLSLAGMILVIRLTSKRNLKTRFNRQKFGSADLAIFSVCLMSFGLVMLWPNQMVGF